MGREKERQQKIAGVFKAETLKSEAAVRLEDAMEGARTKPQSMIEGVEPGSENFEPIATTTLVPRSQTLESDYAKSQEQILKDIETKAGNNPYIMQHLAPALQHLKTTATIRMSREAIKIQKEETAATINENVDIMMSGLRVKPPVPATPGEDGIPEIKLDNDRSYVIARAGVGQAIDTAAREGGMDLKTAETMKANRLAKMDHGRAQQQMLANPGGWLAASNADKNEWEKRLTTESFEKLNTRAHSITQQAEGSRNQARLEAQRVWEQDAFTRVQPDSKNPLTLDEINRAVSVDRVLDTEHGDKWKTLVGNLKNGKWEDDPEMKVRLGLESTSLNVGADFNRRVDAVTRPGGLSFDTAVAFKKNANSIVVHRGDKAQQEGFQAFRAAHTAGTTMLTTAPLLGQKMDQDSKTLTANYQVALLENAARNGWETSVEWMQKNLPIYARQLSDRVDSQINVLSTSLPGKLKTDPKTGAVTPDTIKAAQIEAFKRHGVDPKAAATLNPEKLPPALHSELLTIDKLSEFAAARRALDLKRGGP